MTKKIIEKMHEWILWLMNRNGHKRVADSLDAVVLKEIKHEQIIKDAVIAHIKTYGYQKANDLLEELMQLGVPVDEDYEEIHKTLLIVWLNDLVTKEQFEDGWGIFTTAKEKYPDFPQILIAGIEMAIAAGNLDKAEEILNSTDFPDSFAGKLKELSRKIAQEKLNEGKVTVNFTPGLKKIPAALNLNGNYKQNFLIDTGASVVTIPNSTASALGITIDHSTPQKEVMTAGGARQVYEVMLSSVEIGGWVEYDVRAFVLDLPGQPDLGLLGLNYLNRFQLEIDSDKGILVLTPKGY